jgi:hypothetical protein
MTGKPIEPKGLYCPLWRKDVSKVCHTCALFTKVSGVHPQTGENIDRWMCAYNAAVLAALDTARAAHVGAAVTQELRNDMHRDRQAQTRVLASRPITQPPAAIGQNSTNGLLEDRSAQE